MWKRSELKASARKSIFRNYWVMVAVCFIIALFTSSYADSTTTLLGDSTIANTEEQVVFDNLVPDTRYRIVSRPSKDGVFTEVCFITTSSGEEVDNNGEKISVAGTAIIMHNALSNREYALYSLRGDVVCDWREPKATLTIAEGDSNSSVLWSSIKKLSRETASKAQDGDPGVINNMISGLIDVSTKAQTILFRGFSAIADFAGHNIGSAIGNIIGILITGLFTFFIAYIIIIGEKRYFLEARCYKDTRISRLIYVYRERKTWNVAKIMVLRMIKTILWAFTIVGGFIKYYEYRMIPWILADEPGISSKEAFARSKSMMRGNKWRLFVIDLSFIGWHLLVGLTLGLLGFFYVNQYSTATEGELYITLRQNSGITLAGSAVPDGPIINDDGSITYDENPSSKQKKDGDNPRRLGLPDFRRNYSVCSIVLLFFTFSMAGWIWEVVHTFMVSGQFVNRGTLFGPWLPIYGSGGIIILILLKRFREHPLVLFFSAFAVSGVVEYATSLILEYTKGVKYWDYSGYFLNINGRICLEGLVFFALGGCIFVYFLAPLFDDLYNKISRRKQFVICAVLMLLFACDNVYSKFHPNIGAGITDAIIPETTEVSQ